MRTNNGRAGTCAFEGKEKPPGEGGGCYFFFLPLEAARVISKGRRTARAAVAVVSRLAALSVNVDGGGASPRFRFLAWERLADIRQTVTMIKNE